MLTREQEINWLFERLCAGMKAQSASAAPDLYRLRDLALRGLQGPTPEEVAHAREQIEEPDSQGAELLARAIIRWEEKR
jgi:hypothetical protein